MTKETILIVDDDSLMLELLNFIFSTKGVRILTSLNGQEALEILDNYKQRIDLIITDHNMPVINGLELANAVKGHPKHQHIPLVLISSNTEITFESGKHYNVFDEIIHKPFSSELIFNKVAILLSKQ
jgi:two-component system chemotaxis response regulator CheY